ncbi:MAG: bifunctional 2-polyprenyl-6-hydroxyphenol methylase/3-demethylubiquinol 3-O-methyltransferase UbiG [Proteobacteria bacterium]|nr:bifunctional 2-polyprenyl-6-hydroxyphenol methylase/3-demethylubiquinol 3-O-methyltransferase UbiG [Pseudomonadota bacterium]
MSLHELFSGPSRTRAIDPLTTRIDNDCYDQWADGWWDPSGPGAALHGMNPVRCEYFSSIFARELGCSPGRATVLDVGCGGGLVTEEMARRGYRMIGIDVSEKSLDVARRHAAGKDITVQYQAASVYELPFSAETFDGIVISDVLEHLHDLPRAVAEVARVLRPGGALVFDTINRTLKSYAIAIALAQKLFPVTVAHTHDWSLFIKPRELDRLFGNVGLRLVGLQGLRPARSLFRFFWTAWTKKRVQAFKLTNDVAVGYIGYATKQT